MLKQISAKTTRRLLVVLLVLAGAGFLAGRVLILESEKPLQEDRAWRVTLTAGFNVVKRESIIYIPQPYNSKYVKLLSVQLSHPGLRLLNRHDPEYKHDRLSQAYKSGAVQLNIQYVLQQTEIEEFSLQETRLELTTEERELYLRSTPEIDLAEPLLMKLNNQFSGAKDQKMLVKMIFKRVHQFIGDDRHEYDQIVKVIQDQRGSALGKARIMLGLCRLNHLPARINIGFNLVTSKPANPVYWVEVFDEQMGWQAYDPDNGYQEKVPRSYVLFKRGHESMFNVSNGEIESATYSIEEDIFTIASLRHVTDANILELFDLRRLDVDTRNALALLLLLPFGVLISSFCRHVLGLFPYGTFTVTLLALAAIYSDAITTAVTGSVVILLASVGRMILPHSLTRIPRLSIIFTFVVMSMVLSISVLDYFELSTSGRTILLPIIILTSLIDRFYSYWDSDGMHSALIRLGVTALIAMLCIPVLQNQALGQLLLRYPELHLFTAALMLGFSAYSRKKLTDFPALRLLGENKKPKKRAAKPAVTG